MNSAPTWVSTHQPEVVMVVPNGLRFAVLGPLTVTLVGPEPERDLDLGALKQRVLLATLLCHPNSVVSVDVLVDALWWDNPPRTAHKNIQVYVSHLRQVLGAEGGGDRILFHPPGYTVKVGPDELDSLRFEQLVRVGRTRLREGDPEQAAAVLQDALALWQGPALGDLTSVPAIRAAAVRYEERRLNVLEDWIEAELTLGHHADVLDEIESLVQLHPLRERLRSQQMIALYRYGRQAEALSEYDNLRRELARDLGLQPTPALRRLYQAILTGHESLDLPSRPAAERSAKAAPAAGRLAQLPRDIADFTGRDRETAQLLDVLRGGGEDRPPRLVAISGPPGVGKTTLAVHVAHQLRDRFPDGQLPVPLRTEDGGFRPASRVLSWLLRQIGLTEAAADGDDEERTALLRAWLADRRVLLLLDDASGESHVRPLLPGAGDSGVIVTSRRRLGGLESAHHLQLPPFPRPDAVRLLERIVGSDRVDRAPGAGERIVAACGLLPLAIRIAGARLAGRAHLPLADYADRLEGGHLLDELVVGDLAMRSTARDFADQLRPEQQVAFRRLGLLPDMEVTSADIEALLDVGPAAAEGVLDELAVSHVILSAATAAQPMRYVLPNPIRAYARERVGEEPERDRRQALARLRQRRRIPG